MIYFHLIIYHFILMKEFSLGNFLNKTASFHVFSRDNSCLLFGHVSHRETQGGADLRQDVHSDQPADVHRQQGGRWRPRRLHRRPPCRQGLPGTEIPGSAV